jgi:hypothetical protein
VEHAALMVEARLDGIDAPAVMQLDTGADADIVYGVPYVQLKPDAAAAKDYVLVSGTIAGVRFGREWFNLAAKHGGPIQPGTPVRLGTIGAAFFEKRILLLDFVAQRLAILGKGEEVPPEIAQRADFVPIDYRNHKMFVSLTLNGVEESGLFFDTGSSSMAVTTTRARWLEWTGRQADDPGNTVFLGQSWGKDARWVGAPVNSICIGKACVTGALAFFEATGLENLDFDRYPFKAAGLFGNLPFDGRFTVIVDLPNKRFGLIAGSAANSPAQ